MMIEDTSAEDRESRERDQLNRRAMHVLTGGLTREADTFLIAAVAVLSVTLLYPLVGGWAFVAFPVVFIGAILARGHRRRRKA